MLLASSDAAFARAVALRPEDRQLWTARGRYLAWHDRWTEAADAYARGIEGRRFHYDWVDYGASLVLAGDRDRYEALCARVAAEIATMRASKSPPLPGDLMVAARIARLWPGPGPDRGPMVQWADEALRAQPGDAGVHCEAAAVRYRAGRFEEAIRLAERSLNMAPLWPSSDLAWYVLAMAHHRLGHAEDARRWFDKAEATADRRGREAAKAPYPPLGSYLNEDLDAQVLRREARDLLGPGRDAPQSAGLGRPGPSKE
jgi:tetratricopeptide (TPR) repeat protein